MRSLELPTRVCKCGGRVRVLVYGSLTERERRAMMSVGVSWMLWLNQDGPLQQSLQLYSMKPPSITTALTLRHAPNVAALQHYSTLQPLQPLQPTTAIQPLQYTALYTPPLFVGYPFAAVVVRSKSQGRCLCTFAIVSLQRSKMPITQVDNRAMRF